MCPTRCVQFHPRESGSTTRAAAELQAGVDALGKDIEKLHRDLTGKPALLELLPDVQIFHNAVRYALSYDEFYDRKEPAIAHKLLRQGTERATQLREGKSPWTTATGLIVRGYRSMIDGRCSHTAWWCRRLIRPMAPMSIVSIYGVTAAARN